MEFLVKACLIEEDFTVATLIEGGKNLANNFQQYGPHYFSPDIYPAPLKVLDLFFYLKITQYPTRFQTYGDLFLIQRLLTLLHP